MYCARGSQVELRQNQTLVQINSVKKEKVMKQMNPETYKRNNYWLLDDPFEDDNDDVHETTLTSAEIIYAVFADQSYGRNEPKTLNDAWKLPEWPEWEKAINIELEQL